MAMASWAIKQEQESTELGEPKGVDFSRLVSHERDDQPKKIVENDPWLRNKRQSSNRNGQSPFQGKSPFTK